MKKAIFTALFVLMVTFGSCIHRPISQKTNSDIPLSEPQQHQLDSILQCALDFEALYTIIGKIKPMSSVASFSFPIANTDSLKQTKGDVLDLTNKQRYLDKIAEIQTLLNTLNYPDLKFVLLPYRKAYNGKRTLQLSVVRVSLLDSLLRDEASFFGQYGLVPGSDPAVVLTLVERCDRYERFRAYGYLFGYPEYAIDFFVDAFAEQDRTNELLERNFFRIPTYSREKGNFVYAYPKDHTPDKIDSTLYFRAQTVLYHYKEQRGNYLNLDSTLQSRKLLNDFFNHETR